MVIKTEKERSGKERPLWRSCTVKGLMAPGKVHFCSGNGNICSFFQSTVALGGEISFIKEAENGRKETTQG